MTAPRTFITYSHTLGSWLYRAAHSSQWITVTAASARMLAMHGASLLDI